MSKSRLSIEHLLININKKCIGRNELTKSPLLTKSKQWSKKNKKLYITKAEAANVNMVNFNLKDNLFADLLSSPARFEIALRTRAPRKLLLRMQYSWNLENQSSIGERMPLIELSKKKETDGQEIWFKKFYIAANKMVIKTNSLKYNQIITSKLNITSANKNSPELLSNGLHSEIETAILKKIEDLVSACQKIDKNDSSQSPSNFSSVVTFRSDQSTFFKVSNLPSTITASTATRLIINIPHKKLEDSVVSLDYGTNKELTKLLYQIYKLRS